MKRVRRITINLLFVLLILAGASAAARAEQKAGGGPRPKLSLEERVIRQAYARLMLFNKAARLRKAEDEVAARRPEHDLRFEIRNVKTGPIEEIYDERWADTVTGRFGEVLSVVPGATSHNGGPKHAYYLADWVDAGYRSSTPLSDTVRDVLGREPENMDVGKYTSYEVTVHYEGRQRTYRAMVIYHQALQSVDKTRIEFLDNVVGSYPLGEALTEQNPPMRFPWGSYVRTRAYEQSGSAGRGAGLRDLRAGGQEDVDQEAGSYPPEGGEMPAGELKGVADGLRRENYFAGQICDGPFGMCCNDLTMTCCFPYNPNIGICDPMVCEYPSCAQPNPIEGGGGGGEEPGCTANTQRGEVVEKGFEDFERHIFVGYVTRHTGWAKFKPKCVTDTACTTSCYVNLYGSPAYGYYDDGPGTTSDGRYHAVRIKTEDNSGGTASRGQTVSCSAAVAMAFKSCTDPSCSFQVSLTLGPSGWQATSDGFFEAALQHSMECQAPQ